MSSEDLARHVAALHARVAWYEGLVVRTGGWLVVAALVAAMALPSQFSADRQQSVVGMLVSPQGEGNTDGDALVLVLALIMLATIVFAAGVFGYLGWTGSRSAHVARIARIAAILLAPAGLVAVVFVAWGAATGVFQPGMTVLLCTPVLGYLTARLAAVRATASTAR